ncbi:MAG: FAD-dependent oxidoreductase, partial [Acidobacteria bacterium]|nr:FAD-dependent oxidoreductase [Acidobacteriota bacterium]
AAMSQYLVQRIEAAENVEVKLRTQIVLGSGTDHLESLTLVDLATDAEEVIETNWLFAFIGALPRTEWLGEHVARDEHGFILTGADVAVIDDEESRWRLARAPFLLETSVPGVFAAGDVRRSSMKRVASAVGEGSNAVSNVHLYFETV